MREPDGATTGSPNLPGVSKLHAHSPMDEQPFSPPRAEQAERAAERAAAHQKRMQDMQQRLQHSTQSWSGSVDGPPLEKLVAQAVDELTLRSPSSAELPERVDSVHPVDQLDALSPGCRRRVEEVQNKHRETIQKVDDARQQAFEKRRQENAVHLEAQVASREAERKAMEAEHARMDDARVAREAEAVLRTQSLKQQQQQRAAEDAAADAEALRSPEVQRIFETMSEVRSAEALRCAELETTKRVARAKQIEIEAHQRLRSERRPPTPPDEHQVLGEGEEVVGVLPDEAELEARRAELAERAAERAAAHQQRMQDMQQRLQQNTQSWSGAADTSDERGSSGRKRREEHRRRSAANPTHVPPADKSTRSTAELEEEAPPVPELLRKLRQDREESIKEMEELQKREDELREVSDAAAEGLDKNWRAEYESWKVNAEAEAEEQRREEQEAREQREQQEWTARQRDFVEGAKQQRQKDEYEQHRRQLRDQERRRQREEEYKRRHEQRGGTGDRLHANAAEDEAKWGKLADLREIKLADVPFPQLISLRLSGRVNFKKLAKRWHPDKFAQVFGSRLCEAQRAEIMERVQATFVALNDGR